jgi:hypothetical protein
LQAEEEECVLLEGTKMEEHFLIKAETTNLIAEEILDEDRFHINVDTARLLGHENAGKVEKPNSRIKGNAVRLQTEGEAEEECVGIDADAARLQVEKEVEDEFFCIEVDTAGLQTADVDSSNAFDDHIHVLSHCSSGRVGA